MSGGDFSRGCVCVRVSISLCLSICLSVCLPVCLSVCLSMCVQTLYVYASKEAWAGSRALFDVGV